MVEHTYVETVDVKRTNVIHGKFVESLEDDLNRKANRIASSIIQVNKIESKKDRKLILDTVRTVLDYEDRRYDKAIYPNG